jgi:3-phenylpropionate/cinnamic acid dioxygenase small subunit
VNALEEKDRIKDVLIRYAEACDRRRWELFTQVFRDDAVASYGGEFHLHGRSQIVAMIRSMLGGCGPTQHLLGNFQITIHGRLADSRCYVRAAHAGCGAHAGKSYEVWAEYEDHLVREADTWLITRRRMHVYHESGTRELLEPG